MSKHMQFLTQALSGQPWAITPQMLDHLQQLAASGKHTVSEEQVTPEATAQKVPLVKANGRSVGVVTKKHCRERGKIQLQCPRAGRTAGSVAQHCRRCNACRTYHAKSGVPLSVMRGYMKLAARGG